MGKLLANQQNQTINALFSAALQAHQQGNQALAEKSYREILVLQPQHADSTHLLGVIHMQRGELAQAEQWIRRALLLNDRTATYWNNLGEALRKQHRLQEARECLNKAISLSPEYADAYNNLGNICSSENDPQAAAAWYEKALQYAPQNASIWYNLGSIYRRLRLYEKGIASHERALELKPDYADAYNNLGLIHSDLNNDELAQNAFEQALKANPSNSEAQANLGQLLLSQQDLDRAMPLLLEASSKVSGNAVLQLTLAMAYATVGKVEAAANTLAGIDILQLTPEAHSNALFFWNYDPFLSRQELFARYRDWSSTHLGDVSALPPRTIQKKGGRLRIGYYSADFRFHAVQNFLLPLLGNHDKRKFQVFAYSNNTKTDEVTEEYKKTIEVWRDVARLTDRDAAQLIRKDEIDVLVDLSAHTRGGRLRIFAFKPAPIQVSWLGYGYTTGLDAIDYFIADEKLTPAGTEEFFSEGLARLDRPSMVYRPPAVALQEQLPCTLKGYVTFGSLSRLIRLNSSVLGLWAQIMHRVPGSRLLLNQPILKNQIAHDTILQEMGRYGIEAARVELQPHSPHWDSYANDIDIALDPFPHNAGTTTFEALWMGVPVISLRSRPSMGRFGDMILTGLGRPEWVFDKEADYVDAAVALAENTAGLTEIRRNLRAEMKLSPLMDERGFCRSMESCYENLVETQQRKAATHSQNQNNLLEHVTNDINDALREVEKLLILHESETAETLSTALIAKWPDDARGWMSLGLALRQQQKNNEGIAAYQTAVKLDPSHLHVRINLARALSQTGKFAESVDLLKQTAERWPRSPEAKSLLSHALRFLERTDEAIAAAQDAINTDPKFVDAWQNLGNALRSANRSTEAAEAYKKAIDLDPNSLDARTCLGSILKDRALYPQAREVYEEGLRRSATTDDAIWTNYFFALNYDPFLSAEEIAARYRQWGELTEARIPKSSIESCLSNNDPSRKLNVGIVSADFNRHSIRFFMLSWLGVVDREHFSWTLYSNTLKEDQETDEFKKKADRWRNIRWKSDRDVVSLIREDKIDILIDISGHTAGNKLYVFAAKAAPIQLTMLGTGYTTGLRAIDYFLADERYVPTGSEHLLMEQALRLPIPPFVYQPEYPNLAVADSPFERNGFVTFGCLSRMVRMNSIVIATWIEILKQIPNARLRLDHPQVVDPETREMLKKQFSDGGIDLTRIDFMATRPHWDAYDEIDIAFDPFPHNAGTTTMDSLWKGVPVLSVCDRPPLGRFGSTILHAVGLENWVATDKADYIAKAVALARAPEKLVQLRKELRQRLQSSPLMDGTGFALHFQTALRGAWQTFCDNKPATSFSITEQPRDLAWVDSRLALGTRHLQRREVEPAHYYFELVLKFNPDEARAWLNLGVCWRYQGETPKSQACFEKAVALKPAYVAGWFNLAVTLHGLNQYAPAETAYQRAVQLDPLHHEAFSRLGEMYRDLQRGPEALTCFKAALELKPDMPPYLNNLGSLYERGDRLFEAKRLLEHCLELDPANTAANTNLGLVYRKLGLIEAAMVSQGRGLGPNQFNHPLLFTANYHPDLDEAELFSVYKKACQVINTVTRMPAVLPTERAKLRIGFVGGDFRAHAAAKFLLPLFQYWDQEGTELVIFANQGKYDETSEKFRTHATWIDVFRMSDDEFNACVRRESIDVLIDVAGWTIGSRLIAMAQKPAPVQITWLGYGYTTGLTAVDWFMGSPRFTPPGSEANFSERIWNLPAVPFCYDATEAYLPINNLPAIKTNQLTFGCLSRTVRLNYRVIKLWARVLQSIPNSRLVLDNKPFEDPEVREFFLKQFDGFGVDRNRVLTRNSIPHWHSYHEIDIALDPFPHNAGTTTVESLLMGVPSISLRARPPLGRFGDAILGAVGLEDWVVDSEDDYVTCAIRKAADLVGLAALRAGLRQRVLDSPLCNGALFAKDFSAAILAIWNAEVQKNRQS